MKANLSFCILHSAFCIMFAAIAANVMADGETIKPSNHQTIKPAAAAAPKTIAELRKEAGEAVKKRQYAVARELAATVRFATNATPADFCWAWRLEADLLKREGKKAESRAMFEKLFNVANPADAVWEAAWTYGGAEWEKGFKYLDDILDNPRQSRCPLTDAERRFLWNQYAWKGYNLSVPKYTRKGREMSLKYGGNGGEYDFLRPTRVFWALKTYKDFESFPLDEKDIRFVKTIEDFGVKVRKTVRVAKDFGFDPTNATPFVMAAVTSGAQRVILENVGGPWYVRRIKLPSNIEIVLRKGVRVHTDRTWDQFKSGGIFHIENVSNVVIRGEAENDHDAVVSQFHDMLDRARNCRQNGRSNIAIDNSQHVAVRNLRSSDCAEDGLFFGGLDYSGDMYFENLDLDNCLRQAASLCNIDGGYFRRVRFRNTAGAEPGAGIDLEPAEEPQANSSIYLFDCTFENNLGGGLMFHTSSKLPLSVFCKRCVFKPQRNGDLIFYIRNQSYLGVNNKALGKAIFEDCDFQGFSDVAPIRIDGVSILDAEFRNCTITDTGAKLDRTSPANAPAVLFNLNQDVYYDGRTNHVEAAITFENCRIVGYTNAPPIAFNNQAGHEPVRNLFGTIDYNGKPIDLAKFRHAGPDRGFQDIDRKIPDLSCAECDKPAPGKAEAPFSLQWNGLWYQHPPAYAYLFRGEKGAKARLLLRLPGNPNGDKAIRLFGPAGAATELGEYRQGDNEIVLSFPETGWYSLQPPKNHVLVESEGVALVYFGGMGMMREVQINAPLGYVGYFEVPAKGAAPFKVQSGKVTLRDATGAEAGTVSSGRFTGAGYARLQSKSGKPEVWSFQVEGYANIKFFKPFTGVWADTPGAVPAAPGAVRSPVIRIERKAEDKEEVAVADLKSYLAANPDIAQIVKEEAAARLEWAKKGEYTAALKDKEALIERLRATASNERQKHELADEEKGLLPLREWAGMEKRIPEMTPDQLERYAFCQAFAVVHGIYDRSVGADFLRCLRDHDDMPAKYPVVFWWIYKKDYDDYIRWWASGFGLGFRDFTLICDDDKKLDKLIPVLEKKLATFMIDE